MNKQDYISLIAKGLTNEINLKETETLNLLKSTDKDFSSTYDDMQEIWDIAGAYAPTVSFDSATAFDKFAAKYKIPTDTTTKSSNFDYKLVLISAVMIALLVSSSLFYVFNNVAKNSIDNNSNQIETVFYNQHEISLSPGSEVSFDKEGAVSSVTGNAFFNKTEQFTLDLGKDLIVGNNASFNLNQSEDSDVIRIDVQDGSLSFVAKNGNKTDIPANSSVNYNLSTSSLSSNELDVSKQNNYLLWTSSRLSFNRTHLDQVFSEMEDFFGIAINVKGDLPQDCHFTAPLIQEATAKDLFELLHSSFNFGLEQVDKNTFEVSKITCH